MDTYGVPNFSKKSKLSSCVIPMISTYLHHIDHHKLLSPHKHSISYCYCQFSKKNNDDNKNLYHK